MNVAMIGFESRGVSDDGSVIVGGSTGSSSSDEVVWLNQGSPIPIVDFATSLGIDMTGWAGLSVWDISDDGTTLVGQGLYDGIVQGFVLTIPAPGAGAMLLTAGALGLRR